MEFTARPAIFLNFEIYFLEFLWEIIFGVVSGNYLFLQLLKNAITIILVQHICPLRAEIVRFPSLVCLNKCCLLISAYIILRVE